MSHDISSPPGGGVMFQCSSASRKFLNRPSTATRGPLPHVSVLFSEPKIPQSVGDDVSWDGSLVFQCSSASRKFLNVKSFQYLLHRYPFQCSSASRKFLNQTSPAPGQQNHTEFQCSSASRKFLNGRLCCDRICTRVVSVLFSEPKIPQCCGGAGGTLVAGRVSVLFSEPKIPQSYSPDSGTSPDSGFSALQRAENSSIR